MGFAGGSWPASSRPPAVLDEITTSAPACSACHEGHTMRSRLSILKYAALWVVMLALGLGLPTRAAALPYSFTLIADSSGPFSFNFFCLPRSTPGHGGVSVVVGCGGQGIFTGTGAVPNVTTTIADTSGPFNRFSGASINAGGTVAFFANLKAGGQGIFTGTGAVPNVTTTIADTSGPFNRRVDRRRGTVAFCDLDAGGSAIVTGTARCRMSPAHCRHSGAFLSIGTSTSINAGGTVAFQGELDAGELGVFTGTGAVPNVTTTIADSSGPLDARPIALD